MTTVISIVALSVSILSLGITWYRSTSSHIRKTNLYRMRVEKSGDIIEAMHALHNELFRTRSIPNHAALEQAKSEADFPKHLLCDDEIKWVIYRLCISETGQRFDEIWLKYRRLFPQEVRTIGYEMIEENNSVIECVNRAKGLALKRKFKAFLEDDPDIDHDLKNAKIELFLMDDCEKEAFRKRMRSIIVRFENKIEKLYFTDPSQIASEKIRRKIDRVVDRIRSLFSNFYSKMKSSS